MSERPIRSRPTPFFRHGFWSHLFLSLVFVSVIRVVGGKGEPAHLVGHGRSLPVYKKKIFPFDDYQCYLFLARIDPELGHPSKSPGFEDFLPLLLLLLYVDTFGAYQIYLSSPPPPPIHVLVLSPHPIYFLNAASKSGGKGAFSGKKYQLPLPVLHLAFAPVRKPDLSSPSPPPTSSGLSKMSLSLSLV